MKPAIYALSRLVCTLAVFAIVVVVNRPVQGGEASAATTRCELNPPTDMAGLEACVAQSPRDVELLLELGAVYTAAGRHAEGRALYARAAAIDPHDGEAQRRLDDSR